MSKRDTQEQIRVVIVEDHPGVRAGIRKLLIAANDIVVVGEGANGAEALELAHAHTPDVMLLDVELPVLRGDEVVRRIRAAQPVIKVLAVSSYNDQSYIQGMMENGASGYITKEEAPELLVEAVHTIYNTMGTWLSPRAQRFASRG